MRRREGDREGERPGDQAGEKGIFASELKARAWLAHSKGEMNTEQSVSIVITSFNHGAFLAEAIRSAQTQTHPLIEIIVVDDGSTDDSVTVAGKFPAVRCITVRHQGLAAARNTGFKYSTGRFVVFLDADDRLSPSAIESGLAALSAHPECGFVYGHYTLIDNDGRPISFVPPPCSQTSDFSSLLQRNHIGMHAAVMYRREVLDKVGGFNTRLQACEDYDLYLRASRFFAFRCHHRHVAEYRQHGSNMSNDAALMLRASTSILRSQRVHVTGNPRYQRALETGLQYWRDYYGARLAKQIKAYARAGNWRRVFGFAFELLRQDPTRLAEILASSARRVRSAGRVSSPSVSQGSLNYLHIIDKESRRFHD